MKKQLRRLSRADLLEMTLELTKENEILRERLDIMQEKLNSRQIEMQEAGSIAEAALRLNGIFEAAQAAADQYLENVKQYAEGCIP